MKHSVQPTTNERNYPLDVPARLYEEARRRLLQNEPLLERTSGLGARVLSAGEVAALESVRVTTAPFTAKQDPPGGDPPGGDPPGGDPPGGDPLAHSVADYMALLETSYTTSGAARQMKVDVSRVRQRLREGTLFGIEYDGERRLPRFQFERRQVLPGLRDVMAILYAASTHGGAPAFALNERALEGGRLFPAHPELHRALADDAMRDPLKHAARALGYALR
jgi:hypothetical protein